MMSILAIGVGWAAETVYYTLDGTQTGGSNGYATESEITQDGITWMVTGNTTMSPWRIGGKNLSNVDRDAYSTTAMGSAISRIDLQLGLITCTANSVKLTVASDASFSNVLDVVTKSSVSANSTLEFVPSSGTEWAKNAYYKFTFNVTCGSSNQYVGLSKAIFYANEGTAPSVATPVISGTTPFDGSTQVTITCATTGASIYYTTDGTDPTTSSTLYSAPFTITQTTTVKAIAELNGETSNIATKGFTANLTISSIAEFNALAVNENFKYTGNNLVFIISNSGGNNHYVQDGSKGMLIFGSLGQTYQPGDEIPGGFTGTRATYNGAPEMTNPAGFTASTNNAGLTPVEITPSEVNIDNFGRYAIIKNAAFNTSAKTITSGGETIAYHTTFNNNIPTDGAAYDVIGVTGFYNNNPQFLPISFEPSAVTGADYYLVGSFNEWTQQDENYKFSALADGGYILNNKTLPDDVLFKVLKVENGNVTWLGGSAGDYFGINKDVCTNIPLVEGANFKMEAGGICTLTISSDMKLSVSKEAQLFLAGTINNWGKTDALEATEDGWTFEKELATGDEFKFIDEWGTWYGGGNTIAEANLGATITLNNGGNFVMAVDGNFVINVAADKSSFVITREAETSTAMFNFNDDYATLFPNLDLTTLPYEIVSPITATVDGISVTISPATGGTTNKIWNNNNKLRVYSGTITVTAPEGYNLTGIDFTNHSSNFNLTPSEGEMGGSGGARTWTGETATLVLTSGSNTQIGTMNVTIAQANSNAPAAPVIEGETPFMGSTEVTITCATEDATIYYTTDGTDPTTASTLYSGPFTINEAVTIKARAYSQGGVASTIATKVFEVIPEVASVTAFYDYNGTDEFAFTGNLVAIAQTGNYLYAQDDTKGVLIYGAIDQTYQKGNKIPVPFYAKKGTYAGAPQMTNAREMQAATESVTLEPVEMTIEQASSLDNYSRYAVIKDATIANEKIVVGTDSLKIYNRFNIETTPVEGQAYNVIGVVGWHNGAQFMPLEYVEVNHTYTVAGEPAALFGSDDAWDINNENGLMTLEDGVYTWTSQPTALEGNVAFRVVKNNSWDVAYPNGNYNINNIKPGTYTLTVTLNPETGEVNATLNGQVDVYVFGYINDLEFVPNQGVKMETEDGKIYTATISTYAVENGYSFFAFTNKLGASASDWEGLNANRFMAQSNGDFLVNGSTMNVELPLVYLSNYCMKIPAGKYTLTVDMENMKLTIAGGTQLSYILESGVEGVDYTIINNLAVVEKNEPTSELFVSDGNDWIAINAGSNYADLASLKGGFTSGAISGKNLNPVFTLSMAPVEGEDVEPVEPAAYSLANEFAPKVNEVIIVSKAYYKASDNALRAYAPGGAQGQSCTVDTSLFSYDFEDGKKYTVKGVINIKEPWATTGGKGLLDYDYPFQNYKLLVLDVTEEPIPTAINGIFLEEGVKSVRYYNAAGVESNVPFRGVNIVVKEMNDGSKVTTKAIIK